jgi:putative transcriptional regulator
VRNRLRVLRAEREWSQARLAEELSVSRQTVNAIETGKYDPSLPLAFRIARLFGRPIEAIFFPDDLDGERESAEPRGGSLPDVSADWA